VCIREVSVRLEFGKGIENRIEIGGAGRIDLSRIE